MKIRIGDKMFDPDETPVVIVFENDNERKLVGMQITDMQDKLGPRAYIQYDPDILKDPLTFMLDAVKMSGYVE